MRAYHETWGLPVLVTHASNNYGPFQFPEKLVPTVVLAALEAAPIPLYGKGDNVRDWIFVEDHVAALLAILERGIPGSTYDVGARSARRNLEVVHTLCALLDRLVPAGKPHASRIAFVADRPGHDRRYAIDPTRLETELGFRTETPFEVGMEATVRWYLEHRDWWERIRREIYDGRRLGVPRARPKGSTP